MPRKRKQALDVPGQEPFAVATPLDDVIARTGLRPASDIDRPVPELEPLPGASEAVKQILAAQKRKTLTDTERAEAQPPAEEVITPPPRPFEPRQQTESPPHEQNGTWEERVARDDKPRFAPVPEGFKNVDVYPPAGVKVNKSLDRTVAAIQFSDDAVPSNAEKDTMREAGLGYDAASRQWSSRDRDQPGANLILVKRIGKEIADERARFHEVMGR